MGNTDHEFSREYVYFDSSEQAVEYLNSLNGLSPAIGSKLTPLLPISSDIVSLIGFESSLPSLFMQFSKSRNVPLPFSRATLFKFPKFASGAVKFSLQTLMKMVNFMWKLTNQKFTLRVPVHATGGAAESWDGLIQSIKQWDEPNVELTLLLKFIEERINLEHGLLMQLKAHSGVQSKQIELYLNSLRKHTLLPDSVIDLLPSFLIKQQIDLTHTQYSMLRCSLKLDFYFSSIACLELGWLQKFSKELPEMQKHRSDWFVNGVVHHFIKPLIFENNSIKLKTPFEFYLDWLASDIGTSVDSKKLSQAKLASFIPLEQNEDTASGYSKAEKQKDLLKDWKKSKYPSPSKFYEFIKNLRGGLTDDALYLIDIGFASIILDRLFISLFNQLKSKNSQETYQAMNICICRYHEYFQYYKNQVITE